MAPALLDVRATRELEAQLEAAKASVALAGAEINQAAAELQFAQSELGRAQSLIKTKTISERALERARNSRGHKFEGNHPVLTPSRAAEYAQVVVSFARR